MGGLGELQLEALAQEQQAVEKAARQRHVVIDDEQPVLTLGRVVGEQPVEVLELAHASGLARVQLHPVAGAQQLRVCSCGQRAALRSLDPEHQHASPWRKLSSAASQAQAPAAGDLPTCAGRVADAPPPRVEAADRAAGAGEEVIQLLARADVAWRRVGARARAVRPSSRRLRREAGRASGQRFTHRLAQTPGAVGDLCHAGGAAAPSHVAHAAQER